DDGGITWFQIFSSVSTRALYFANGFLYAAETDGVYRSPDQGQHWFFSGLADDNIGSFHAVGSTLYAGSYFQSGVFKSDDFGTTWVLTNHPQVSVEDLTSIGSTVYSGTQVGVYRSHDEGYSWTLENSGLNNTSPNVWAVGYEVFATGSEFVGPGQFRDTLYASTDSGQTWILKRSDGLPDSATLGSMVSDRGALYAGFFGTGVFKSVDHGDSWTPVGAGLPAVGDQFYTLAANEGLL